MSQIKKKWLNPRVHGAFAGAKTFYLSQKPKLKYNDILDELRKLEAYWGYVRAPKIFKRLKYIIHFPQHMICSDLIDLQRFFSQNKPYRYICLFLDMFSKRVSFKTGLYIHL